MRRDTKSNPPFKLWSVVLTFVLYKLHIPDPLANWLLVWFAVGTVGKALIGLVN